MTSPKITPVAWWDTPSSPPDAAVTASKTVRSLAPDRITLPPARVATLPQTVAPPKVTCTWPALAKHQATHG